MTQAIVTPQCENVVILLDCDSPLPPPPTASPLLPPL